MTRFWGVEESEKKNKPSFFSAFTLAEMMVVMLILSIVLAAMAPVMTTRNKPNNSSPWQYQANNRSNAWFGAGSAQHAMIGQNSYGADDTVAKLLITVGAGDGSTSLLAFKRGNTQLGRLYMNDDGGMMLGSTNNILGTNANAVGRQVSAYGTSSVAFGSVASALGNTSTAVGSNVTAGNTGSIAIGTSTVASADNAIGIGNTSTVSATSSIALGNEAIASAENAVAIGNSAKAQRFDDRHLSSGAIAIGSNANTTEEYSIAIGSNANVKLALDTATEKVTSSGAIAIGRNSAARYLGSIALGTNSSANGYQTKVADITDIPSIAIGSEARAESTGTIAIGAETTSNVSKSIAIGSRANSYQVNSIAIGSEAKVHEDSRIKELTSGSIAIGKASEATPSLEVARMGYQYAHVENSSIALGSYAVAKNGGIAIGSPNAVMISSSPDKWEAQFGSGLGTTQADNGIAIGVNAKALGNNNIAIGRNACLNVTGANKVCIGANSGPTSGSTEATNDEEMIYLGSAPKWTPREANNWATNAVMVIHNSSASDFKGGKHNGNSAGPTVYINGNLVVRGYSFLLKADDDNKDWEGIGALGQKSLNDEDAFFWGNKGHAQFPGNWWVDNSNKYNLHGCDRRLKYIGKENFAGLNEIKKLQIFNFTYKKDSSKTPHVGVMAQDLQKVFPNAVKKGADGFLTIRMEDMFYAVINAIKELDAKYQAQEKRITAIEKENKELKARLDRLEAKVK